MDWGRSDADEKCKLLQGPSWTSLPSDWRSLDLQSCRAVYHPSSGQLPAPAGRVLDAAMGIMKSFLDDIITLPADISEVLRTVELLSAFISIHGTRVSAPELDEMGETSFLLGALFWVEKSSQNTHVARYIEQCSHVELQLHERGLQWFLDPFSPIDQPSREAREAVRKLRLFLLQFVLSGINYPVISGIQLSAYQDAMQTHKVTFSTTDHRLG